jgi:hypothetical protein
VWVSWKCGDDFSDKNPMTNEDVDDLDDYDKQGTGDHLEVIKTIMIMLDLKDGL